MIALTQTPTPTYTPWGDIHSQNEIAPGIVSFTTGSHGGIWLAPERIEEMPAELAAVHPFAGEGWFEEDCDWALVAASFPHLFTEYLVFAAWQTMKGRAALYRAFWPTERGVLFEHLAMLYQARHATYYQIGSMGTRGDGWQVSAYRLDGKERVQFNIKEPAFYEAFTKEQALAAGATAWRVE